MPFLVTAFSGVSTLTKAPPPERSIPAMPIRNKKHRVLNPNWSKIHRIKQRVLCVQGDLPVAEFVEQSMFLWEQEFDAFIVLLCPEIPTADD